MVQFHQRIAPVDCPVEQNEASEFHWQMTIESDISFGSCTQYLDAEGEAKTCRHRN